MRSMSNNPPVRRKWLDTLADVKTFISETGAVPTPATNLSLYYWVANQRAASRRGNMPADKLELLAGVPGILNRPAPVDQLAAFVENTGRLPSSVAADPHERAMGRYLVYNLRPTVRTGVISASTLAKAEKIPGALEWDRRPDQNSVLEEVKAYAAEHGQMPPVSGDGSDGHRLAVWVRNNVKGNRDTKTPALQARHDALVQLKAAYPSKAEFQLREKIRELEEACARDGWKPAGHDKWLRSRLKATSDEVLAARIIKILDYPTLREHQWRCGLALLKAFEAETGRLPRSWNDGHVYSWLATQRKEHRSGALAGWKTSLLQEVHGALPDIRRRAA